jgi:drug/metabolite transporter (DMT)-like permease
MFGLSIAFGESTDLFQNKKYHNSLNCTLLVLVSSVIAYFLNLSNFKATHLTSPLTVTIVGCIKQITTIILSVLIVEKILTFFNIIGIIITTIGSFWYSYISPPKPKEEKIPKVISTSNETKSYL